MTPTIGSHQGVVFLKNIGWHPETNAFVAARDDWILCLITRKQDPTQALT